MDKRVWKVIGLLVALALVFVIGAAAGGGVVFAATKANMPDGAQVVVPDQADPEPGVVIVSVAPDSPAAEAGINRGDILLEIDGQAVEGPRQMTRYLFDLEPGDEIELTVLHGDDERTLTAVLGDQDGRPYLGVTPCVGPPAEPMVKTLRMAQPGARVIEVAPDSPAEDAGLEVGDLIITVDGQELDGESSLTDLIAEYAPNDTVTLDVQSPGEEPREVSVQLGEHPEKAGVAYLGVGYLPTPHMQPFEGRPLPFRGPHPEMPPFDDNFLFALPKGDFEGGAVVRRVAEDSPAEAAGLKRGDIVTAVDNEPVYGPEAMVDAVADHQPGDVLELTLHRPEDGETVEIEVTLVEHPEEEGVAYLGVVIGGVFITQGFGDEHGPPMLRGRDRRFQFELPLDPDELPFHFDFENQPNRFHFEPPHDDCCDDEFSNEI
jgi:S1-C subfamily serine protease